VDPTPTDRDGEDTGRLGGGDVERRIPDVHRVLGRAAEPLDGEEDGFGIGLVPLRVLEADDDVEGARKRRKARECQPDGAVALGRDDPELSALHLQPGEQREQIVECLERLVQPVVVVLVRLQQFVGVLRVDRRHLRDDALAADGHLQLGRRDLAAENRADCVLHRREDDRAGVDQRPVEVEEDDPKSHGPGHPPIVATLSSRLSRGRDRVAER